MSQTRRPSLVETVKLLPLFGKSDPDIVLRDTDIRSIRSKSPRRKVIFWKNADDDKIKNELRCCGSNVHPLHVDKDKWVSSVPYVHQCSVGIHQFRRATLRRPFPYVQIYPQRRGRLCTTE